MVQLRCRQVSVVSRWSVCVGQIVSARGMARTKMAVPVHHVSIWLMVACSGDDSLVGDARSIVPINAEACFSDITEID